MKKIFSIAIIVLVITTVHAQMENPLKQGMPNTVTLSNGEVIYDLSGEWDAIYDSGYWAGTFNDIIKITQNDNQYVGVYLLKGDNLVGNNEEKIKGKIKSNVIDEVLFHDIIDIDTMNRGWAPSKAEISKDGNEIKIIRRYEVKGAETIQTLSLKRK